LSYFFVIRKKVEKNKAAYNRKKNVQVLSFQIALLMTEPVNAILHLTNISKYVYVII